MYVDTSQKMKILIDLVKNHWELFREKLIDILVDTPIERVEDKIVGSFFFQKRSSSRIQYCIRDEKGIKELGIINVL
jgi:hypothetical protein